MSQAQPMTTARRSQIYGRGTPRQLRQIARKLAAESRREAGLSKPHGATGERIRRPNPRAAHRLTSFWTGPSGECGIECSCGTTLDGFDSIGEAEALHREHTARPSTLRGSIATHVAEYCAPCGAHGRPRLHRRPR